MLKSNNCRNNFKIAYGNSLDLQVGDCESEIRADITVDELNSVRLWGRIVNCNGEPVPNALVKLVKVVCTDGKMEYFGVAHSITDCEGFYQFELCTCSDENCFKVIVSKASYGPEKVISDSKGNCNPCDNSNGYPFDPCTEYETIVAPATKCSQYIECGNKQNKKYMQ